MKVNDEVYVGRPKSNTLHFDGERRRLIFLSVHTYINIKSISFLNSHIACQLKGNFQFSNENKL